MALMVAFIAVVEMLVAKDAAYEQIATVHNMYRSGSAPAIYMSDANELHTKSQASLHHCPAAQQGHPAPTDAVASAHSFSQQHSQQQQLRLSVTPPPAAAHIPRWQSVPHPRYVTW